MGHPGFYPMSNFGENQLCPRHFFNRPMLLFFSLNCPQNHPEILAKMAGDWKNMSNQNLTKAFGIKQIEMGHDSLRLSNFGLMHHELGVKKCFNQRKKKLMFQ